MEKKNKIRGLALSNSKTYREATRTETVRAVAVQGWAQLEGTELRAETYTPTFTVMLDPGAAAIQCRKGFLFNKRHQGNQRAERK